MSRKRHHREIDPPYRDPVFMESLPARPVRIMTEYIDPLERLRREKVGDTIVMFGSARIRSREHALEHLHKLRKEKRRHATLEYRASLRDAKSALEMSRYYEEARELSRRITSWSMSLGDHPRRFVICSGGGPGIMEAANRGAAEAGGKSIGLSIQLPHEQRPNDFISAELSFMFHYFFMRKLWFAHLARALVVFPGGFGTMDELFEALTLIQTRKIKPFPVYLLGKKYWGGLIDWVKDNMVKEGKISPEDLDILHVVDDQNEIIEGIRAVRKAIDLMT